MTMAADQYAMSFVEQGAGDPLLLVHGSMNDSRYWAPQMQAFAAAPLRTMAVNLRHYWPRVWNGTDAFSIDDHIADVADFISALDCGPIHLLGHSRGGYIAFRVAERYPHLVRKLVLAEPAGVLDASLLPAGATPANYAALISDAVEAVRRGEIETGLDKFLQYAVGPGAWRRMPPARQQICRDNAATLIGQLTEGRTPYSRAAAEAIRAPTLLIGGKLTQPAFRGVIDGLLTAIPDARAAMIDHAAHLLNWDNPEDFNAAVLAFLAEA